MRVGPFGEVYEPAKAGSITRKSQPRAPERAIARTISVQMGGGVRDHWRAMLPAEC